MERTIPDRRMERRRVIVRSSFNEGIASDWFEVLRECTTGSPEGARHHFPSPAGTLPKFMLDYFAFVVIISPHPDEDPKEGPCDRSGSANSKNSCFSVSI
jgi:hypothetical protein